MATPESFTPIHDYLVAQWGATTPLYFENEEIPDPATPAAFVYVEIFGDMFDLASLGAGTVTDNLWRERGTLLAHVMVPRGKGSTIARTHARALADLFRGTEIGSIRFRRPSIGAGDPGVLDGSYFAMTMSIEFERDETP